MPPKSTKKSSDDAPDTLNPVQRSVDDQLIDALSNPAVAEVLGKAIGPIIALSVKELVANSIKELIEVNKNLLIRIQKVEEENDQLKKRVFSTSATSWAGLVQKDCSISTGNLSPTTNSSALMTSQPRVNPGPLSAGQSSADNAGYTTLKNFLPNPTQLALRP
jgi:hypothetical protein